MASAGPTYARQVGSLEATIGGRRGTADAPYLADRASVQEHSAQSSMPWQLTVALPHSGQSSTPGVAASTSDVGVAFETVAAGGDASDRC